MCLFFAVLGLLAGFFLLIASSNPQSTPGTLWMGLVLIALCTIPWVRFIMRKSQEQQVGQLQEQLAQQASPQEQPEQTTNPGLTATQGGLIMPQAEDTDEQ